MKLSRNRFESHKVRNVTSDFALLQGDFKHINIEIKTRSDRFDCVTLFQKPNAGLDTVNFQLTEISKSLRRWVSTHEAKSSEWNQMKPYDKKYMESEDAVNFTMPFKSGSVNVSKCIFYDFNLLEFSIYLNFCYRHSFCPMTPINPSSSTIFALH